MPFVAMPSQHFVEALRDLSHAPYWRTGDAQGAFRAITEAGARAMGGERASIWLLSDDRASIDCHDLFSSRSNTHSSGARLTRREHAPYFEAIETERIVAASDALADPRCASFRDDYLVRLGIAARLDAPILWQGRLAGVVCHEHVGAPRAWTGDEQLFAGSMGDLAAQALEARHRNAMERELVARGEELRLAVAAARMTTWRCDPRSGALRWSADTQSVLGCPAHEAPTTPGALVERVEPDDRERVARFLAPGATALAGDLAVTCRIRLPDGSSRWVELRGRLDAAGMLFGVLLDIDARHRLEAEVADAERLAAVGRVAANVAHDFGNMITAVSGQLHLLERALSTPAQRAHVEKLKEGLTRAGSLAQQLLVLGRPRQETAIADVDVGTLVRDMEPMLASMIGRRIVLEVHAEAGGTSVRMPAAHLEQVVVNLVLNGRGTITGSGRIRVAVETYERSAALDDGEDRGTCVCIAVEDDGPGMPEDVRPAVFEPFLSTSPRASGLGLTTAYRIVRDADGRMTLSRSTLGGARFEVLLPRAPSAAKRVSEAPGASRVRGEIVLVVEDVAALRNVLSQWLGHFGYRVLTAATGDEAWDLLRTHPDRVDALISDVVMPGMSGLELVERAMRLLPELRVLVVTGDAEEARSMPRGAALITKPYALAALEARLSALLDEPR